MEIILLAIIAIILLIFFSGAILNLLIEGASMIFFVCIYLAKGIAKLAKKLIPPKLPKRVTVFCPCSNQFLAAPQKKNGWIVQCPQCGRNLRVDISQKKPVEK